MLCCCHSVTRLTLQIEVDQEILEIAASLTTENAFNIGSKLVTEKIDLLIRQEIEQRLNKLKKAAKGSPTKHSKKIASPSAPSEAPAALHAEEALFLQIAQQQLLTILQQCPHLEQLHQSHVAHQLQSSGEVFVFPWQQIGTCLSFLYQHMQSFAALHSQQPLRELSALCNIFHMLQHICFLVFTAPLSAAASSVDSALRMMFTSVQQYMASIAFFAVTTIHRVCS
jgi:hypothetical protein